ncbi:protein rep [Pseudomonas putida]|nr:protein rep [Pseudomonas putida]
MSDPRGQLATKAGAGGELVTTAKFAARIHEVIDEKTGEIQRFTYDSRSRQFVVSSDPEQARTARYQLQIAARRLLPNERVSHCVRTLTNSEGSVGILRDIKRGKAHFSGLQTCGSPWNCPVCSAKISERRKVEIREAVNTHVESGGGVEMVTLTVRHSRLDVLKGLMGMLRDALKRMREHRDYKHLRKLYEVVGSIRALEVTHGQANGWHPHLHELWLFPVPLKASQRAMLHRLLFSVWKTSCARAGLPEPSRERGVHIQQAHSAADYVAKWGCEPRWDAATELTKANSKKSRSAKGRTPFDLLRDYASGDSRAGALFAEFAEAFKGFNQCRWSPGLKAVFGVTEMTNEEIAADQSEPSSKVTQITRDQWKQVLKQAYDARTVILKLAETGGHEAVHSYLKSFCVVEKVVYRPVLQRAVGPVIKVPDWLQFDLFRNYF